MIRSIRRALPVLLVFLATGAIWAFFQASSGKDRIPWRHDYASALVESQRTHKPMLAYFTADWCGYCQEMRRTTWSSSSVASALNDYVPVKIDVDAQPALAEKYQVQGLPGYMVLSEQGAIVKREEGWQNPADFIRWLRGSQPN